MKMHLPKSMLKCSAVAWLIILSEGFLTAQTQTYTNPANNGMPPNTFSVAHVTKVTVEAWGGGGAGGGCTSHNVNSGGGGGGGTFTRALGVMVPGPITVTVGAGGAGVAGGNGNVGLPSSFNSAPVVSAAGGSFGTAGVGVSGEGPGGAVTIGITHNGGAGSLGVNSNSGWGGAGGGGAGNGGNGGNAITIVGGAGGIGSPLLGIPGGMGAAGRLTGGNGNSTAALAAGGGGAHNSTPGGTGVAVRTGGSGGNGQVVVRYIAMTTGMLNDCYASLALAEAAAIAATTVTDDCAGSITVTASSSGDACNTLITVTATNACGNESVATYSVSIVGGIVPPVEFECGEDVLLPACPSQEDVDEAWDLFLASTTASGGCNGMLTNNAPDDPPSRCGGSVDVTFTYTSGCDEDLASCTITFEVTEAVAPDIEDPASDQTVECDGDGNQDALNDWLESNGGAEATSDCDFTWNHNFTGLSDDCGATGSATVTFTATDNCGNVSSTTAIFTIVDTTDPEINTPASGETVECDGAGNDAELQVWLNSNGGAAASDICSDVTWSNDFTALSEDCGATGSATVTFTATDDCGNASSTTATFIIVDTTDPEIDPPASGETVECDGAGNEAELEAWLMSNGGAAASDICSDVTWSNDFVALSDDCGATGSATVTFTATDDCGNASSTTATFIIVDTTDPEIDTPASDETVECDGGGNEAELEAWLLSNGNAAASDICSDVTWSNDFVALSDDCGATGFAMVTFTATDDCGNASLTTATFTIVDTTDPEIDPPSSDETVECDGAGNVEDLEAWLLSNGNAAASDICSDVTWSNDFVALSDDCGATGSATVTFTATDDCGNSSQTTAIFTIVDTTDPEIGPHASDETVECDGAGNDAELQAWLNSNGGAAASDICSDVTWSNDFVALSDDCGATGSAMVTFTATDDCGNASSTTATFTIVDTTDPEIDTPASDETVECDGDGNQAELEAWLNSQGGAAASDICSDVTWSNDFTSLSDDCGATGSATVTFTATDDCGNASSTTATFTIVDTTDPEIDTPASDETVECDGDGNQAELEAWLNSQGGAAASDICSDVTWSNDFTALSDDCGATGSAIVIFTATDDCGNASSTTATFTIVDTTDPEIDTPALDETVECDGAGNENDLVTWLQNNGNAAASDICSDVTWSNDFVTLSDDCGATGSATVIFTATDDCGNATTTTATFTIVDTTDPDIETSATDETVDCDGEGNEADLEAWLENNGGATASDICSDVTWSNDFTGLSDDCGATGSATVTFTATDDCGNSSQTVATFTIADTTAPEAICQDITIELDPFIGEVIIDAEDIDNGSNDACGSVSLSLSKTSFTCENFGNTIVTLTVEDECGLTSTCTATVTISIDIPGFAVCGKNDDKVEICHYPPGNPDNLHTICINPISLCDHLAHGDVMGACEENKDSRQVISAPISHHHDGYIVDHDNVPGDAAISVHPNPFNREATMRFALQDCEHVSLTIYNQMGQRVDMMINGLLDKGEHTFILDGARLPEGFYFYVFTAGNSVQSGMIILQR